jgi:hypothetical protein
VVRFLDQPIKDADLLIAPLLDLRDGLLALALQALDRCRLVKMRRGKLGPLPAQLVDLLMPRDGLGLAAAITSAVYHATGIRVRELPVRIEDLLQSPKRSFA